GGRSRAPPALPRALPGPPGRPRGQGGRPARLRAPRRRHAPGLVAAARRLRGPAGGGRRRLRGAAGVPAAAHGRGGPLPPLRRAHAVRRPRPPRRGARSLGERAGAARSRWTGRQGHPRCRREPHAGRDHRAARAARRPGAAAAAGAARADHGLHGPLPRRRHRRDAPHAGRAELPRLHRARPPALAGRGAVGRRVVHPLLRARRAGAPRDAVPRTRDDRV
ncbi:MAG: Transmembrane component NikQ of energizing module of nickel ECF transporter, partial [uncultured Nocardioidaceae bacterium]